MKSCIAGNKEFIKFEVSKMKIQEFWPVLILIFNTLIAFAVLVLSFFRDTKKRGMMMLSWFIFIVPLAGIIYLSAGLLINYIIRRRNVDMSDVSFSQEREKLILPPNKEAEMNYVPIYDAIAVSDTANLRKLLLDTMLGNTKRKLSSVAIAMNSNDTESSHYAATMIMDALSKLRPAAQDMVARMKKFPEDVEMNLLAFDFIYEFLGLKIMSEIEQAAYIYTLDDVAENLFTHNLWYMTATHYLKLTDLFISVKDYGMAKKWCLRAEKYRPHMLDTYKAKLHLLFNQQNYKDFLQCLKSLKNSETLVDDEIIDLFRTYYS